MVAQKETTALPEPLENLALAGITFTLAALVPGVFGYSPRASHKNVVYGQDPEAFGFGVFHVLAPEMDNLLEFEYKPNPNSSITLDNLTVGESFVHMSLSDGTRYRIHNTPVEEGSTTRMFERQVIDAQDYMKRQRQVLEQNSTTREYLTQRRLEEERQLFS